MKWLYFLLLIFMVFSCRDDEEIGPLHVPALMEIPEGFPDIDFPEGNEFTKARWDLGKQLFFDKALSVDSSISCASCHQPALAFSDDVAFSLGVEEQIGTRNSPSLSQHSLSSIFHS